MKMVITCDGDCNDTDATTGASDNDQDGISDCSFDCDPNFSLGSTLCYRIDADGIDQDCSGEDAIYLFHQKNIITVE